MTDTAIIDGCHIQLATPEIIAQGSFVGRAVELRHCAEAWGFDLQTNAFYSNGNRPMNFLLHGPSGIGKTEIVYELSRRMRRDLFVILGHEDLTADDLTLALIPKGDKANRLSFGLRASPAVTALHKGALLYIDGINRIPERALSCLASLLDDRRTIYSAVAGLNLGARDKEAADSFRCCCSIDGSDRRTDTSMPEYIAQRCLPVIFLEQLSAEELVRVGTRNNECRSHLMDSNMVRYVRETRTQSELFVMSRIAHWTRIKASVDAVADSLLTSLAIDEKQRGSKHPDFRRHLAEAAKHCTNTEQYDLSIRLWKRFLEGEETRASSRMEFLDARQWLADAYLGAAQYELAEAELLMILKLVREFMAYDDSILPCILNQLGICYRRLAYYERAAECYEEALELHRKKLPATHSTIATITANIGVMHWYSGRYRTAGPLLEEALRVQCMAMGEGHVETATILNSVARLYATLGRFAEATTLFEKSLRLSAQIEVSSKSDTAYALDGLAIVCLITKQLGEAARYSDQALSIRAKCLSDRHPLTARSLFTRGRVYQGSNDFVRALDCYRNAHETSKSSLRAGHPDIAAVALGIGELFLAEGQLSTAETWLLPARETLVRELGHERPQTACANLSLAKLYHAQAKLEDALVYASKALGGFRNEFQESSIEVISSLTVIREIESSMTR